MSSCDSSSVKKNYIVQAPTDVDILSACTGFYTNNIYNCSGNTLNLHSPIVSANTINANIYLSGGTNILDLFTNLDNFTTGSTLIGTTVVFDRTNSLSAYTLDLSTLDSNNTFVTGFTYDNSNNLTLTLNDGVLISTNVSQFSGITVDGGVSATTISACTGIYTSNLYGCSPITVNDNLILLSGITFSSITQDNSLTQILSRDSVDGFIKYRDVNSITSGITSENTYVTGFTYDNVNTFSIRDNSGTTFNTAINVLSATTISATTYFGDGSNLTGISTDNFYVSGGTYNTGTKNINFSGNDVVTTFDVDLTTLISSVSGDTFVVSGNANAATSELTFSYNTGGTFTVTNSAALFSDNDINVTGGTYNSSNGCVTFGTNSGTTFDVCGFVTGMTDSYTTGTTLVGETIQFDSNVFGPNYYNVSLSPILSGKTNNTTFNTYTSDTQTIINSKVSGATNLSTTGLFAQKNGEILEFKGVTSTGGTVTITNDSTTLNIDVTIPDTNTFVTGGTVTGETTIVVTRNDNVNISITGITSTDLFGQHTGDTNNPHSVTIGQLSGVSETLFNTYTGDTQTILNTKVENGGNVGGSAEIFRDKTGTTLNFRTLSGGTNTTVNTIGDVNVIDVLIPTDLNTFVTGFTYYNVNTFTINDNVGSAFTTSINVLSATTISATTFYGDGSNLSGITHTTDTFVTGGTYSDITDIITITNSTGGTFNITGITDTFVTGGTYISGTTSLDFSGNTGFAPFSVNVSELIDDTNTFVSGFTYNDSNTLTISQNNGTTFDSTINIMTGLTVNGDILWGDSVALSLNTTVKKSINSGLTEIYSIPLSTYTGGFFDYTVTGGGARAGSIMSIFSGTTVQFNETTTTDIGDTSGITFDMNISGGTANLTVSATTNSWEIRTIVRSI